MNNILERNRLSAVLLKTLEIYCFNNFAKIKEIATTYLHSAIEFQSAYYVVGKEKVAEHQTKYSTCNSFRVRNHLLKLAKSAIIHLASDQSPNNQKI